MQNQIVNNVIDSLAKRFPNLNPNVITVAGIIPSLLFFVFTYLGLYPLALIAYLGNALDALDGAVARAQGKASAFGAFLDSTIDRISDFLIIGAFGFAGIVSWELTVIMLSVSFLVSYTRSRGELASKNEISFKVGLIERQERLYIVFAGFFLYLLFPALYLFEANIIEFTFCLLIILSIVTVLQRLAHAHRKFARQY